MGYERYTHHVREDITDTNSCVKWSSIFYTSPVADGEAYWGPTTAASVIYTNIANIDRYIFFFA